ncbi:WD40 repeat domain-containing protein [Streptosporangium sp. G11]|uniref:WD40 repeat domain-containing protein n=1 Tax=Streptosporangium sp. G11 TaxID=3436926 RepID=UPI003EBFF301
MAASISDVQAWDLGTRERLPIVLDHGDHEVTALAAVSRGDDLVAVTGCADGSVHSWDMRTGRRLGPPITAEQRGMSPPSPCSPRDHVVEVLAAVVLDDRFVALAGGWWSSIELWDLETAQRLETALDNDDRVGAAFLHWIETLTAAVVDGRPVAVTGGAKPSRVWDLRTGDGFTPSPQAGPLPPLPVADVRAAAITVVDGWPVAVTGDAEGGVRRWNLRTGQEAGPPLRGHSGVVNSVAVAVVDGRPVAVTGGDDSTVRLWDLAAGEEMPAPFQVHCGRIKQVAIAYIAEGPVAISLSEDDLRVWDVRGDRFTPAATESSRMVRRLATAVVDGEPVVVVSGGEHLASGWRPETRTHDLRWEGETWVCDLRTGRPRPPRLAGVGNAVATGTIGEEPVVVAGVEDGATGMWSLRTGRRVASLAAGGGDARAAATTVVDGRHVVLTLHARSIRVADLNTGELLKERPLSESWGVDLASVTVDGRPLAVTLAVPDHEDGPQIQVWDLRSLSVDGFSGGDSCVTYIDAFAVASLNGDPVVIMNDDDGNGTVRVWDLRTGEPGPTLLGPVADQATAEAFGWDGERRIGNVTAIAADPASDTLAVAVGSGAVLLWDDPARRPYAGIVFPFSPHALAWGPGGELVVGFGRDVAVLHRS